jgi:hypothetical protein
VPGSAAQSDRVSRDVVITQDAVRRYTETLEQQYREAIKRIAERVWENDKAKTAMINAYFARNNSTHTPEQLTQWAIRTRYTWTHGTIPPYDYGQDLVNVFQHHCASTSKNQDDQTLIDDFTALHRSQEQIREIRTTLRTHGKVLNLTGIPKGSFHAPRPKQHHSKHTAPLVAAARLTGVEPVPQSAQKEHDEYISGLSKAGIGTSGVVNEDGRKPEQHLTGTGDGSGPSPHTSGITTKTRKRRIEAQQRLTPKQHCPKPEQSPVRD